MKQRQHMLLQHAHQRFGPESRPEPCVQYTDVTVKDFAATMKESKMNASKKSRSVMEVVVSGLCTLLVLIFALMEWVEPIVGRLQRLMSAGEALERSYNTSTMQRQPETAIMSATYRVGCTDRQTR